MINNKEISPAKSLLPERAHKGFYCTPFDNSKAGVFVMNKITCVYIIRSTIKPERFYIGSATNFVSRKQGHIYLLRRNKHHAIKLQNHYNKYGEQDLIWSVLEKCSKEDLLKIEQKHMDELKPWFNSILKARNRLGIKLSEETKEKLRQLNLGRKLSEETKKKIGAAHKGKKRCKEWKNKISQSNKGKKPSKETRIKMSNAKKESVGNNTGKKWTEEMKAKQSERFKSLGISKGHKLTEDVKRRISKSMMCNKNSKSHKEEVRKKISESLKKYHEEKREKNAGKIEARSTIGI